MEEFLVKVVSGSALMIGALGILAYFVRRGSSNTIMGKFGIRKTSTMSVVEVLHVGGKRHFILVDGVEKRYLVFATPQGNLLIDTLEKNQEQT